MPIALVVVAVVFLSLCLCSFALRLLVPKAVSTYRTMEFFILPAALVEAVLVAVTGYWETGLSSLVFWSGTAVALGLAVMILSRIYVWLKRR